MRLDNTRAWFCACTAPAESWSCVYENPKASDESSSPNESSFSLAAAPVSEQQRCFQPGSWSVLQDDQSRVSRGLSEDPEKPAAGPLV